MRAESLDQLELGLEDEKLARATLAHSAPHAAKSTPWRLPQPLSAPEQQLPATGLLLLRPLVWILAAVNV